METLLATKLTEPKTKHVDPIMTIGEKRLEYLYKITVRFLKQNKVGPSAENVNLTELLEEFVLSKLSSALTIRKLDIEPLIELGPRYPQLRSNAHNLMGKEIKFKNNEDSEEFRKKWKDFLNLKYAGKDKLKSHLLSMSSIFEKRKIEIPETAYSD